jgi:hypothetical protein
VERIFEPFPRPILYLFGLLLVIGLLAPFWLPSVSERLDRPAVIISDDLDSLPAAPPLTNGLNGGRATLFPDPDEPLGSPLSRYGSVHLDTPWEALSHRYALHLKNTRGMQPEIYEATGVPGVEQATFYFYERLLKEFVLVYPQQRMVPLRIVRMLQEQFGEPNDWSDEAPGVEGIGLGLSERLSRPADAGLPAGSKPSTYPYRQVLTWFDGTNRLTATIKFSSKEPVECVSQLTIHVSAASWIDAQRSVLMPDDEEDLGEGEGIGDPAEPAPSPRLFP